MIFQISGKENYFWLIVGVTEVWSILFGFWSQIIAFQTEACPCKSRKYKHLYKDLFCDLCRTDHFWNACLYHLYQAVWNVSLYIIDRIIPYDLEIQNILNIAVFLKEIVTVDILRNFK